MKSQQEALLTLFKSGRILNWVQAFKLTGCSKLSTRISDFRKLGFVFKAEKKTFKTRYKTNGYYFEYSLDLKKTKKSLLK